jgi:YD repeat-containing protein
MGRLVMTKDARGNVNRNEYDAMGHVTREIHADGGTVTRTYNVFGNKVSEMDSTGGLYLYL